MTNTYTLTRPALLPRKVNFVFVPKGVLGTSPHQNDWKQRFSMSVGGHGGKHVGL